MLKLTKKFSPKKKTISLFLLVITMCIFYKFHMNPQCIERNYKNVLLKTYDNNHMIDMKIEGEITRKKLFSNQFYLEGTLKIDNKKGVLKNNITTGKLFLFQDKEYNNTFNGSVIFDDLSKKSNNIPFVSIRSSSDFKKVYINAKEDLDFEIFANIHPNEIIKN